MSHERDPTTTVVLQVWMYASHIMQYMSAIYARLNLPQWSCCLAVHRLHVLHAAWYLCALIGRHVCLSTIVARISCHFKGVTGVVCHLSQSTCHLVLVLPGRWQTRQTCRCTSLVANVCVCQMQTQIFHTSISI